MSSDLDCRAPRARACANLVPIPRALKNFVEPPLRIWIRREVRERRKALTREARIAHEQSQGGQVSKTAEHARAVPAINVTKWRTTNKVLPRSFASRQSASGELLVKNMGSVKRTTLLVCLGVSS